MSAAEVHNNPLSALRCYTSPIELGPMLGNDKQPPPRAFDTVMM
jgi:hypothetical protein